MNKDQFYEYVATIKDGRAIGQLLPLIQYFDSRVYSDDLERDAVNRLCVALAKMHAGLDVAASRDKVLRWIEILYWRTVK